MSFTRFIPAISWLILSFILLCLPGSDIPSYPWLATIHADKLVHIALFCILCFLFCLPFRKSALSDNERQRWFLLILICGIAYGTIMEFVQKYWTTSRSFDFWDIVADSAGCLIAFLYSRKKWIKDTSLS